MEEFDEYAWLDEGYNELDEDELIKAAWEEMHYGIVENIKSIQAANLLHKQYNQGTLEWLTKDHTLILVQEMEQAHIYHTIQFLSRTGKGMKWSHVFQAWRTILNKELRSRKKNKDNGLS